MRRQTDVRNVQTANRVSPRPKPSSLILLPIASHPNRRCQTCAQQNATKHDRMQQNATKCNENSCPPARTREATTVRLRFLRSRRSVREATAFRSRSLDMGCAQTAMDYAQTAEDRTPRHSPGSRHSHTLARHSRTHPRHSREGGNPSRPGRYGFEASLGVAAPEPSCR